MTFTVLLVDDDADLLPSMVTMLEELSDFQLITAVDGLQGLTRIVEDRPDCIVIDVRMPELNGYQLVQVLRGDPDTADIPIIILSALVQERDQWRGLALGTDRYLTKPVEPADLIQVVKEVVRLGEADRLHQMEELDEQETPRNSI